MYLPKLPLKVGLRPRHLPLLLVAALGVACQSGQAPIAPPPGPAQPSAADTSAPVTPKTPRLVFAIGAPGTESSTPRDVSQLDTWVTRPAYEYLIGVDKDGKDVLDKVSQLATEWAVEPDGKSYRFKLRKGVQFHYGKGEITADDVIFSWQHLIATDSLNNHSPRYRAQITDIEKVNDYEVVFRLRQPDLAFIWNVGETEGSFEILSKKDADSRPKFPPTLVDPPLAGTGPYFVKERKQGQYVRFERIAGQHYRKTADFPEFEWRFIPENSTRLAALLTREVQMAALPQEMIGQAEKGGMKAIKAVAAVGGQSFVHFYGPWAKPIDPTVTADPTATTPISDVRVRKALSKAINRNELNTAFLQGRGTLIYNLTFHPSRPGWNPDWEKRFKDEYGYDPEAAKKLLADAGYGPGKALKHTMILSRSYGYYPELKDMAEAVANYWRLVGVDVTIDQPDPPLQTARTNRGEYTNHTVMVPTSVRQFFGIGIYAGGYQILNTAGLVSGKAGGDFTEPGEFYLNKLRPTIDPSKWDGLFRELGNMLYERHTEIPLFWLPVYAVVDPQVVAEYPFSGTLTGPFANVEYIRPAR